MEQCPRGQRAAASFWGWEEYAERNWRRDDAVTAFVMASVGKEIQRMKHASGPAPAGR
eukprot:gene4155-21630_t